jgi:cell division protein FtsI/penicillin-binding protein 2
LTVSAVIQAVVRREAIARHVRKQTITAAREQADKGLAGSMEGHGGQVLAVAADAALRTSADVAAGVCS